VISRLPAAVPMNARRSITGSPGRRMEVHRYYAFQRGLRPRPAPLAANRSALSARTVCAARADQPAACWVNWLALRRHAAIYVDCTSGRTDRRSDRSCRPVSPWNFPVSGHGRGDRRLAIPRRRRVLRQRTSAARPGPGGQWRPAPGAAHAVRAPRPTARPCATSSATSVSRPRHRASRPPAAADDELPLGSRDLEVSVVTTEFSR